MKLNALTLCALVCTFLSLVPAGNLFSDFIDDVEGFNGQVLDTVTWETRSANAVEIPSQNDALQMSTGNIGDFAYTTRHVGVLPGQTISVSVEITDERNPNNTTAAALMLSTADGQFSFNGDTLRLIAQINENTNTFQSFVGTAAASMGSAPVLGNRFRLEIERAFPTQVRMRVYDASDQLIGNSTRFHPAFEDALFVSLIMRGGVASFDDVTIPNIGPVIVPLDDIDIQRGVVAMGELADTIASDDKSVQINPGFTLSNTEAPVRVVMESAFPIQVPESINMTYEAGADTPGLEQTLELFNWASGQYEPIDVRAISILDQKLGFDFTGSGVADYVERDTRRILSRVRYRQTGFTIVFPWTAKIDFVEYFLR